MLANIDPRTYVWTWSAQKNAAFVQRRMAHESAVHRVDAELAAGFRRPIAADLAADGVDEFLEFFFASEHDERSEPGESIHLHSTDCGDEWLVTVRDGVVTTEREHAKGDAAVRAGVSDLLLLLWRRLRPDDVEVLGDRKALERFLARTSLD